MTAVCQFCDHSITQSYLSIWALAPHAKCAVDSPFFHSAGPPMSPAPGLPQPALRGAQSLALCASRWEGLATWHSYGCFRRFHCQITCFITLPSFPGTEDSSQKDKVSACPHDSAAQIRTVRLWDMALEQSFLKCSLE